MSSHFPANAHDSALQLQIAELRDSVRSHRARARKLWDSYTPQAKDTAAADRATLGAFTEKLKSQKDEVYG